MKTLIKILSLIILFGVLSGSVIAQNEFITTWKTDNTGTSNSTSITIPTIGTGYNYDVDWDNDGSFDQIGITGDVTHDFGTAGTYTIRIRGTFPRIYFNNSGDRQKILSVDQWGNIAWTSMWMAFFGCSNINSVATDSPDLSGVTDMTYMFADANSFNGNINNWDVSNVISMQTMFRNNHAFNQPLNSWDVSNVTDMSMMFLGCNIFNQPLNSWDVSNVTDLASMFGYAYDFNQPLNNWNVSSVTNMSMMFYIASAFNQPLNNWDVSNVTDMSGMFVNATSFNQNLGGWNIGSVTDMTDMLKNSELYFINYDNTLIGWESQSVQSNVTLGASGLKYCAGETARASLISSDNWTITGDSKYCETKFITSWQTDNPGTSSNTSITIPTTGTGYWYAVDWDNDGSYDQYNITGDVTHDFGTAGTYTIRIGGDFPRIYFNNSEDKEKILSINNWGNISWVSMENAFYGCSNLTSNATDSPDLSGVTNMSNMFRHASSFNSNINSWDVGFISNMSYLFYEATSFNQPLDNWNVSLVTNMSAMFGEASSFNQPLSWYVANVTNMTHMFNGASSFNQDLSLWNVSSVTNMSWMFQNSTAFNQNLGGWNIGNVTSMQDMLSNSGLDGTNYDNTLLYWENQTVQSNVSLGATGLKYCGGDVARTLLILSDSWTITGDENTCDFVTSWKTDNAGSSNSTSITIPTTGSGYNYQVDWNNDGTYDQSGITGNVTHDYGTAGTYTIRIKGDFPRIYFNNVGDAEKIIEIKQWGNNGWTSMESAFYGCSNLTSTATDTPDFSSLTNMANMLNGASLFNSSANSWDVSNVINMSGLFKDAVTFNQSISSWSTANVTDMYEIFRGATSFNQNINSWTVISVANMQDMFHGATAFNQPLDSWTTSAVTNMSYMFYGATAFNHTIDSWNVSAVTNMSSMFGGASSFNQPLNSWDVGNVTNMSSMFNNAYLFNQELSAWNVSDVTDMKEMFRGAIVFNKTIDAWFSTSSVVQDMSYMFYGATAFNQPLSSWLVSNVHDMSFMFNDATAFNQPLNSWFVANVTDMESMFQGATTFNQPLNSWNVSNVTTMENMFRDANAFNQPLGSWTVSSVTNMLTMFYTISGNLDIDNYDNTLIGWESNGVQNNVDFGAQNLKYCTGENARSSLVNTYGWNILGDSKDCPDVFITNWITDNPGSSNSTSISIPTIPGETYNYSVDWDSDGVYDQTGITGDITHDYGSPNTYQIRITGTFPGIYFNNSGDKEKIVSVVQWGDIVWSSMENAFYGCSNLLTLSPTDSPDLSSVSNMANMFNGASAMNSDINSWNVGNVTNMSGLFMDASAYNQPLSSWATSSVTNMLGMFTGAYSFNQSLNSWTVSSVTNMSDMFRNASAFNQPLSNWITSAVTNMSNMFLGASSFNQSINSWSVNLVTDMSGMFQNAISFNQALNSWTVSSVSNMSAMFYGATAFNQPLGQWTVANVQFFSGMFANATTFNQNINSWTPTNAVVMEGMFYNATSFNEPVNSWNVSNVQNMVEMFKGATAFNSSIAWTTTNSLTITAGMFSGATSFNQSLNSWDVSNVTNMTEMFKNATSFNSSLAWTTSGLANTAEMFSGATSFNQPIDSWNMTGVTNITAMFSGAASFNQPLNTWTLAALTDLTGLFAGATSFNQPLNLWSVSNITIMEGMFDGASSFNQNLGGWDINNVTNMIAMLNNSGLDIDNYDNTLIGWQGQSPGIHQNVNLGALNLKYCSGEAARTSLINTDNWTISGDAKDCSAIFITTWKTDNPGTSNSTSITIPTTGSGYNYDVDWNNDGVFDQSGITGDVTHDYGTAGTYTVRIKGTFPRIYFNNSGDKEKILSVDQWGDIAWTSMESAFYGCDNLTSTATDQPDLSSVTNMSFMFKDASFNNAINSWDVSTITDMSNMFNGAYYFNQPLNSWNTSSVVDMASMFAGNSEFNQNLGGWDITNVVDMNNMLDNSGLGIYNYDNTLIGWAAQSVQPNVDLGALNLKYCSGESARDDLTGMLGWTITGDTKACTFTTTWKTDNTGSSNNTSIIIPTFPGETYLYDVDWDNDGTFDEFGITGDATHNYGVAGIYIVNITGTFPRIYFNNSGDKDKILSVDNWGNMAWTSMEDAFFGCSNLTSTASDAPDLSNVTNMSGMFTGAVIFNSDINHWNVSNVVDMYRMFWNAIAFNQSLNDWDISNVTNTYMMFYNATAFNQPLNDWDVDNVTDMEEMFLHASSFNQPLNNWDVDNVTDMSEMFKNATSFNQNLGDWDIGNVTDMSEIFDNSGLDITNYDSTLIGWENQTVQPNVTLGAGGLEYCDAYGARYKLINNSNWTIVGDGHQCPCLWVTNTNNEGSGSLREAMNCSSTNDTIKFSPALDNSSIGITTSTLGFGHKVSLLSSLSRNITINASAIDMAFHTSLGIDANMEGLKIICGNSTTTRCLENNSSMLLKDVEFTDSQAGTGGSSVLNNGTLIIEGTVKLQ